MNKRACKFNPYMNHNSYNVFFMNLANPLKIGIILSLRKKDKCVNDIIKELNVEQSKVSHALKTLKNCNIVDFKQNGKEREYYLNKDTILPMLDLIDRHAIIHCKGKCCMEDRK